MGRQLIAAALFCCLAACGGDSPTAPARDWVEIAGITPARGTRLVAGQQVTFTVTASVTLASTNSGTVGLVISDHGNRTLNNPPAATAHLALTKGSSTVTLTDTITAPEAGWTVTAAAVLWVEGSNRTAMIQRASFEVQ